MQSDSTPKPLFKLAVRSPSEGWSNDSRVAVAQAILHHVEKDSRHLAQVDFSKTRAVFALPSQSAVDAAVQASPISFGEHRLAVDYLERQAKERHIPNVRLRVIGLPFGFTDSDIKSAVEDNVGFLCVKHVSIDHLRNENGHNIIQLTSCAVYVAAHSKICPRRIQVNNGMATVFDPRDPRDDKPNKRSSTTPAAEVPPTYASMASKSKGSQPAPIPAVKPSPTPAPPVEALSSNPISTAVEMPSVSAPAETVSVSASAESPSSSLSASLEVPPSSAKTATADAVEELNPVSASPAPAAAPSLVQDKESDTLLMDSTVRNADTVADSATTPVMETKRRPLEESPSNPVSNPKRLEFEDSPVTDQ